MAEGSDHLTVSESIHDRVERAVAIVTELDKLKHAIHPWRGREVLWVIRADHGQDKEREPRDNEKSCNDSDRDRQPQILLVSLSYRSVLGNVPSSWLAASETINEQISEENYNERDEKAGGSHEKRVNLLPAVVLHGL